MRIRHGAWDSPSSLSCVPLWTVCPAGEIATYAFSVAGLRESAIGMAQR